MGKKKAKAKKYVGFLLDESGSMAPRRQATIEAVNEYFDGLEAEGAVVTFATFDTEQNVRFRETGILAQDLERLSTNTYIPNAGTPLYDAVGKMIQAMEQQVKPEDKVLIVIVTDGCENSSREFRIDLVKTLITQKENAGWAFGFLGAAPEAWSGAGSMGVNTASTLNVQGNQIGAAMKATHQATTDYFAGRVTARNLYDRSRHIVDDEQ